MPRAWGHTPFRPNVRFRGSEWARWLRLVAFLFGNGIKRNGTNSAIVLLWPRLKVDFDRAKRSTRNQAHERTFQSKLTLWGRLRPGFKDEVQRSEYVHNAAFYISMSFVGLRRAQRVPALLLHCCGSVRRPPSPESVARAIETKLAEKSREVPRAEDPEVPSSKVKGHLKTARENHSAHRKNEERGRGRRRPLSPRLRALSKAQVADDKPLE